MEHAVTKHQYSQKVADELKHFLADTYALYLKTQNFHWNVKGADFYSLHKMFEEQYIELAAAIDEIAERIRSIGSHTPASFSQFAQLTSIEEEKNEISSHEMLQKLLRDHEIMAANALEIIPKAQKAHDEGTADLLIERSKVHDKVVWMLKSSLR
jgi:starvation-inducible DNA-binding protein